MSLFSPAAGGGVIAGCSPACGARQDRFSALDSVRSNWASAPQRVHPEGGGHDAAERMRPRGPLFMPWHERPPEEAEDLASVVFADAPVPRASPQRSADALAPTWACAHQVAWHRDREVTMPLPENGELGLCMDGLLVVRVTRPEAQRCGFQPGDVIHAVNNVTVNSSEDFRLTMQRLNFGRPPGGIIGEGRPLLTFTIYRQDGPGHEGLRSWHDDEEAAADGACCLGGGSGARRARPTAATLEDLHRRSFYPLVQGHSGRPAGQRASDAALRSPYDDRYGPVHTMSKHDDAGANSSGWFGLFSC